MLKKCYNQLQSSMLDYLEHTDSYDKQDVYKCMKIIDFYLSEITKASSQEEGLMAIEKTVIMLNLLNEDCAHELIETFQRDEIATLINQSATEKGFNDKQDDLTEQWRTW